MDEMLGVLFVDAKHPDRRVIAANDTIHKLLGYRDGELIGMRLNDLIPKRSRAIHDREVEKYMQDPQTRPMGADREVYALRKDGGEIRCWIGLDPQENRIVVTVAILDVSGIPAGKPLNPPPESV